MIPITASSSAGTYRRMRASTQYVDGGAWRSVPARVTLTASPRCTSPPSSFKRFDARVTSLVTSSPGSTLCGSKDRSVVAESFAMKAAACVDAERSVAGVDAAPSMEDEEEEEEEAIALCGFGE